MSAAVDLQTVLGRFMAAYLERHRLSARQGQVCAHIRDCRTPAMGALEQRCTGCGFERVLPGGVRSGKSFLLAAG